MTPTIVAILCVLIGLIILVWDAFLYLDNRERNSISQVVIDLTKKSPLVPALIGFAVGLLFGHWWG